MEGHWLRKALNLPLTDILKRGVVIHLPKARLYNLLVNKQIGISYRYHRMHDGSKGIIKVVSWVYLLLLNFFYYCLFVRFIGRVPKADIYEIKRVKYTESESSNDALLCGQNGINSIIDSICKFDYISFDIFDTLIFRPLTQSTDVFYFLGDKLGITNFKNIRSYAEFDARGKCYDKNGHYEVSLRDIWDNLSHDVFGGDADSFSDKGQALEIEAEKTICYANPFMLEVWNRIKKLGKPIIVVSDMYLPAKVLGDILEKSGFTGFTKLYVSCEYGKSKAEGSLYDVVRKDFPGKTILHIGDNEHSDVEMAGKHGITPYHYQNVNKYMLMYRAYDMSYLVGSAYRGLVSNHLYNGLNVYSMEYEYGFIYGGLFVLGYCNFIHDYCEKNKVDTLLFLSRDGDILLKAYKHLWPESNAKYVFWSRKAATKLMAAYDKHDFFRRFIYHKQNQKYSIKKVLESMELSFLVNELGDWQKINDNWNKQNLSEKSIKKQKFIDLKPNDELTDKNGYLLRRFIEAKWDKVIDAYAGQLDAAGEYYKSALSDSHRAVAVDIGWAGSGAMALRYLVENAWNIPCEITGIVAGTNTIHNAEPDASEPFLQSGKLVSYMYSQSHNRDLLKKHDPNKDYNVYWELLLSSPTPQFKGFYRGKQTPGDDDTYISSLDVSLQFGDYDANLEGIKEIQRGIMDFVTMYRERFGNPDNGEFAYMYNISGRDAYAPMLVAASHNERYLKAIAKKFKLEKNVV